MENIILQISKIYDINRDYYWSHPNSPGVPGSGKNEPDNTYIFFILLCLIIYLLYLRINQ